jgi:hypothetical protein
MARTQQDRLAEALINRGFREVQGRSKKFRTFTKDDKMFYFVGKAGALRRGATLTDSFSHTFSKDKLLSEVPA